MTLLASQAADLFGVHLAAGQVAAFDSYARELVAWNAHANLTTITEPHAIRVRHFLDSFSLVQVCSMVAGLHLVDVGTGAGFPGLPLAIAFPNIHVTLLEATSKKIRFLDHIVQTLQIPNAMTLNARAEEAGRQPDHRAQYDVAVARAVARLPALLEYLLPLVQVGGQVIAMKGQTASNEAAGSARALQILGGELRRIETIALPGVDEPHHLVVVEKTAPTPENYPRRPGVPTRKPL